MDAAIKQKWVEALRGPNFVQGRGELWGGRGPCALGVLCMVAGLPLVYGDRKSNSKAYRKISKQLGLSRWRQLKVVARNDGIFRRRESFAQIADYAEANL